MSNDESPRLFLPPKENEESRTKNEEISYTKQRLEVISQMQGRVKMS